LFDAVVEPGDVAQAADSGPTANRDETVRVSPVSLVEVVEPVTRAEAARSLGLDPNRTTVLMTLGTGRLGEIAAPGAIIVDAILANTDWQIAVVKSSIARNEIPIPDSSRIIPVTGVFPLARYLSAFDAAVSAAGYNSVHELIPAGIPTLLIPNVDTRTDDQIGRARQLATMGVALTARPDSAEELRRGVAGLADDGARDSIREAIAGLPSQVRTGGAKQTVDCLLELITGFQPPPLTLTTRLMRLRDEAKEAVKRLLGPGGTNTVRRLLGRPPIDTTGTLTVVVDGDGPVDPGVRRLRFLSEPSIEDLAGSDPVEHLLEDSSTGYRANRELIAGRFYEIINRR
jgi:hypothetical protein